MVLGGLQKLTLINYPGKLACTVFCSGCNFRCPFCYNPELVLPEKIKKHSQISEKELFEFLKKRQELLEGVVLTGGEPTLNQDLPDFCQKIKELGYAIKLDTNGSNPGLLEELISNTLVDYIALDVKAPPEKYIQAIGLEKNVGCGRRQSFWTDKVVENLEKSINLLKKGKIDFEFRTTIVPNLLTKKDILKIAQWISPAYSARASTELSRMSSRQAPKYFLQNFRPQKTVDPEFEKVRPCSSKYLLEIQKSVAPFFGTCQIRE